MTDDVSEHLTDAAVKVWGTSEHDGRALWRDVVAAVLAALRPEDAHRVPAWVAWVNEGLDLKAAMRIAELVQERDEARAEVERLKAENERLRGAANRLRWAGFKSIDDDYERGKRHAEDDIKRQLLKLMLDD